VAPALSVGGVSPVPPGKAVGAAGGAGFPSAATGGV
jgi:hypothetical protein